MDKNKLKQIRENFPLIVAIPTLLGGLWQLIELIRISPIFLRFFSINQMVSDGLLVGLAIFLVVVIPYSFAQSTTNAMVKHLDIKIILLLSVCIIILPLTFIFNDYIRKEYPIYRIIIWSYLFFTNICLMYNDKLQKAAPTKYDKYFLSVISFFILPIIASDVKSLIKEFSKSETSLENFKTFKTELYQQHPCAKFEYFNDKYIFIQIDSTSKEKSYLIKDVNEMIQITEN